MLQRGEEVAAAKARANGYCADTHMGTLPMRFPAAPFTCAASKYVNGTCAHPTSPVR